MKLETSSVVQWFEDRMTFIETCFDCVSEVNVYNETVINFNKKYYRIYIQVVADIPKFNSIWTRKDFILQDFLATKEYTYYPAKGLIENYVILHYEWIEKSCKIRFKNAPFKYNIKSYSQETADYFKGYD